MDFRRLVVSRTGFRVWQLGTVESVDPMIDKGTAIMKKYLLLTSLVSLLVGCGASAPDPAPAEEGQWTPPALAEDGGELPEGREVVQRMIDFMQGHQELAVEARVTYESVQESGQKLQFDMLQRIAMRKPDRLFWVTLRDDATQDTAWFDKGRFRVVRQPANM